MKYELSNPQTMADVPSNTTHLVCSNMRLDTLEGMPASVTQLLLASCSIGSLAGISPRTVVLTINNCVLASLAGMPNSVYDLKCFNLGVTEWRFADTQLMLFSAERCDGLTRLELPTTTTKVSLKDVPNLKSIQGTGITTLELAPDSLFALRLANAVNLSLKGAQDCTGLANLPAACTTVTLDKSAQSLRGLPATVTKLQCVGSVKLDSLDHAPSNLEVLECRDSPVESLEPLAATRLKYLDCSGSGIETLQGLPDTLETLICTRCPSLSELGKLPPRLKHLDCSACTWLDDEAFRATRFPLTLKHLNVSNCQLKPPYPLRLHMVPKVVGIDRYQGSLFRVKHRMVCNGDKVQAAL